MASRFLGVQKLTPILATLVLTGLLLHFPTDLCAQAQARQHFACEIGYTKQECQAATSKLKNALAQYSLDTLGQWTWVLVRPVDWRNALAKKGINVNDPAFSNLTNRVTLLDGSLVEGASIRATEMRMVWHLPIEELLDLTIRHELAHAFCNERDESKANRIAIAMKGGASWSCKAPQLAENHADHNGAHAP